MIKWTQGFFILMWRSVFFCSSYGLHKKWKLRIWPHLLKKFLIENFIFCEVWRERAHDS